MRNSTMSLSKKGQSSQLFTQEQEAPANLRQTYHSHEEIFVTSSVLFHTNKYGETSVRTTFKFVSKTEIKSRPGKQANQDSPWKTKRANSCWSQIWDPEARTSSRVWQKYRWIKWNYWFSANESWSYYYQMWAIQARSITTRRNTRTKSRSSWNLYQEYARHWRIAEKSRVKGRGVFKKKIDWRLWGSNFILPGLELSKQSTSLATTTRSTQMLRLTTSTPGIRWLHHCTFRSEKQVRACCRFIIRQRESLFQGAQSILASTGQPVDWMSEKYKSDQEFDTCQIRIFFGKTREQLLAKAKSEILRHEYRAHLAENNICELWRQNDSQAVEIGHTRTGYEQSRREQALLHEELADRERALRDTRIGSV